MNNSATVFCKRGDRCDDSCLDCEHLKQHQDYIEAVQVEPVVWLIELRSNDTFRGWWRGCARDDYSSAWTTDANRAIKFATKQDADLARVAFNLTLDNAGTKHLSTEHMWIGGDHSKSCTNAEWLANCSPLVRAFAAKEHDATLQQEVKNRTSLIDANRALVAALDRINDVLNGVYVDSVAGIVNRAISLNEEATKGMSDALEAVQVEPTPESASLHCRKCGDGYEIQFTHATPQQPEPEFTEVANGLPEIDVPVLAMINDKPFIYPFCRVDTGDDGWMWAGHSIGPLNDPESYDADDDYDVVRWMVMPAPKAAK